MKQNYVKNGIQTKPNIDEQGLDSRSFTKSNTQWIDFNTNIYKKCIIYMKIEEKSKCRRKTAENISNKCPNKYKESNGLHKIIYF